MLEAVTFLLIMVAGGFMCGSRVCAPACCAGFEDVPACCPCNCFAQLDLPYYIWFGLALFFWFLDMVFMVVLGEDPSMLRLLRFSSHWSYHVRAIRLIGPIM